MESIVFPKFPASLIHTKLRTINFINIPIFTGFTGKDCDKSVVSCEVNPCQNEAMCLHEDNQPVCYCVPDYHGPLCELRYNDCESKFAKCENGGTCIDGINSFTCSCPWNYGGIGCENLIPISSTSSTWSSLSTSSTPFTISSTLSEKSTNSTQSYDVKLTDFTTVLYDVATVAEVQSTTSPPKVYHEFSTLPPKSSFEGRSDDTFSKTDDVTTQSTFGSSSTLGIGTSSTLPTVFQVHTTLPSSTVHEVRSESPKELSTSTSTVASTIGFSTFSTLSTSKVQEVTSEAPITESTTKIDISTFKVPFNNGTVSTVTPLNEVVLTTSGTDGLGIITMVSVTRSAESTTQVYDGIVSTLKDDGVTLGFSFNCSQSDRDSSNVGQITSKFIFHHYKSVK